jgi:hypothetical protein
VVLVGQKKAIAVAVRNVSGWRRWSKLDEWLLRGAGIVHALGVGLIAALRQQLIGSSADHCRSGATGRHQLVIVNGCLAFSLLLGFTNWSYAGIPL